MIKTILSTAAALAACSPALADEADPADPPARGEQMLAELDRADNTPYEQCGPAGGGGEDRQCVLRFKTTGPHGGYYCRMDESGPAAECVSLATRGDASGDSSALRPGQLPGSADPAFRPGPQEVADAPVLEDRHKIAFDDRDDADQLVCWAGDEAVGCADRLQQGFRLSPDGGNAWSKIPRDDDTDDDGAPAGANPPTGETLLEQVK